jgi:hypothetical protein
VAADIGPEDEIGREPGRFLGGCGDSYADRFRKQRGQTIGSSRSSPLPGLHAQHDRSAGQGLRRDGPGSWATSVRPRSVVDALSKALQTTDWSAASEYMGPNAAVDVAAVVTKNRGC